jgi:hypothetical protein
MSFDTKLRIVKTCVFSTMLYGCETWKYKKADRDRILAFEISCYRNTLRISWIQTVKKMKKRERD